MDNAYDFDPTYGYSLDQLLQIKPPKQPDDFDLFWRRRYRKALRRLPRPQLKDTGKTKKGWRVFMLDYDSTDDFVISGWVLLPQSGVIKRGMIIGHGYGGRDNPDYHLPFKDAALFFPCFRGLSLSAKAPISSDPSWHVLHHIDTLERYIIGGCVEDIWLAVSAVLRLFPQLDGHLGYLGISFSGGIGALALAYDKRIARGHLNVPTFGHHPLRLRLPTLGSAHSQQQFYKRHKKHTLGLLRYFDAVTAAKRIKIPMHLACAKYDPCVAPPGQFAIYNAIAKNKELFVLKAGHHDFSEREKQEQQLLEQLDVFFKTL